MIVFRVFTVSMYHRWLIMEEEKQLDYYNSKLVAGRLILIHHKIMSASDGGELADSGLRKLSSMSILGNNN